MSTRSDHATQGSQSFSYHARPAEVANLSRTRSSRYAQDTTEPVNVTLAARASASSSSQSVPATSRDHSTFLTSVDYTLASQSHYAAGNATAAGMTPSPTSTENSTRGVGTRFGGGR